MATYPLVDRYTSACTMMLAHRLAHSHMPQISLPRTHSCGQTSTNTFSFGMQKNISAHRHFGKYFHHMTITSGNCTSENLTKEKAKYTFLNYSQAKKKKKVLFLQSL